jgi:hypothetical protein
MRRERPTALSIGKLFQKRLVGRPAWIENGRRVATLRRTPGHVENRYRIDLTVDPPGQSQSSRSSSSGCQEHSPHSSAEGTGKGDAGKDSSATTSGETKSNASGNDGDDLV